jgi:tetratricopeptide (TPR) repeat protein
MLSIGPLALAGTALARFANFIIPKKPWLQSSLRAGLLLILGMARWQRTLVYKSEETLWTDALAKNPACWMGYNNLGNALFQKGPLDGAIAQFQKAVEIEPNSFAIRYNLGNVLFEKGELNEAITQFQEELRPEGAAGLSPGFQPISAHSRPVG